MATTETVKLETVITCPDCGHVETETMPTMPASGFMTVKAAQQC